MASTIDTRGQFGHDVPGPQISVVHSPHYGWVYGVKVKFCVAGILTVEGDGVWIV